MHRKITINISETRQIVKQIPLTKGDFYNQWKTLDSPVSSTGLNQVRNDKPAKYMLSYVNSLEIRRVSSQIMEEDLKILVLILILLRQI